MSGGDVFGQVKNWSGGMNFLSVWREAISGKGNVWPNPMIIIKLKNSE